MCVCNNNNWGQRRLLQLHVVFMGADGGGVPEKGYQEGEEKGEGNAILFQLQI